MEVQGQWNPRGAVEKSNRVGKTWDPDQPHHGEEDDVYSQVLGFGFPCDGSFLSYLQFRKCTIEIKDVVPFHQSPLPHLSYSLPDRLPLSPSLTSDPEARPLARRH